MENQTGTIQIDTIRNFYLTIKFMHDIIKTTHHKILIDLKNHKIINSKIYREYMEYLPDYDYFFNNYSKDYEKPLKDFFKKQRRKK